MNPNHPANNVEAKGEYLKGKKIWLGITGSVSCVETVGITRALLRYGADVTIVANRAVELALEKARKHGLGIVGANWSASGLGLSLAGYEALKSRAAALHADHGHRDVHVQAHAGSTQDHDHCASATPMRRQHTVGQLTQRARAATAPARPCGHAGRLRRLLTPFQSRLYFYPTSTGLTTV